MSESHFLIAAGCLAILVGGIHSAVGEVLIFNRMRRGAIIPTDGGDRLRERHVRILWASWHLVTIFGLALAIILLRLGMAPLSPVRPFLTLVIALSMAAGGLLVLYATRGRHPGWIGLVGVAVLTWLAG